MNYFRSLLDTLQERATDIVNEDEDEDEDEDEEVSEEEAARVARYNSILTKDMIQRLAMPSVKLATAMLRAEGKDGDCDFCLMFDVDECYLHRTTGLYEHESVFRDLVADVTINHNGLVFKAGFSTKSNRWVLFIKGDIDSDDD